MAINPFAGANASAYGSFAQPQAASWANPSTWGDALSAHSNALLGLGGALLSGNLGGIGQAVAGGANADRSQKLQSYQLSLAAAQRKAADDYVIKLGHPELKGAFASVGDAVAANKPTVIAPGSTAQSGFGDPVSLGGGGPSGAGGPYIGTGMDNQNWNLVIKAQSGQASWDDPAVQAAWAQVTQPVTTYQQTPQGLMPISKQPNIPPGWGPPQAMAPSALGAPPTALPGAAPTGGMGGAPNTTVGNVIPGTATPLTEVQSKDVYFASNASGALPVLDKLGTALTSLGQNVGSTMLGKKLGNYVKSADYQQAEQAGNVFINAIERKESGAAIGATENETYGRTFLPQPGDKPPVLAQKALARQHAIDALKAGMPPQAILAMGQQMLADPSIDPGAPPSKSSKAVTIGNVTIEPMD